MKNEKNKRTIKDLNNDNNAPSGPSVPASFLPKFSKNGKQSDSPMNVIWQLFCFLKFKFYLFFWICFFKNAPKGKQPVYGPGSEIGPGSSIQSDEYNLFG